jgi:hypothetical protein
MTAAMSAVFESNTREPGQAGYSELVTAAVSAGPWCELAVDEAARTVGERLRGEALAAKLEGMRANCIELFLLLVEIAPELLPRHWSQVHEALVADERYWVHPKATLGDLEQGHFSVSTPFINRRRVRDGWDELLERARNLK